MLVSCNVRYTTTRRTSVGHCGRDTESLKIHVVPERVRRPGIRLSGLLKSMKTFFMKSTVIESRHTGSEGCHGRFSVSKENSFSGFLPTIRQTSMVEELNMELSAQTGGFALGGTEGCPLGRVEKDHWVDRSCAVGHGIRHWRQCAGINSCRYRCWRLGRLRRSGGFRSAANRHAEVARA
jgi:hypothetical protein